MGAEVRYVLHDLVNHAEQDLCVGDAADNGVFGWRVVDGEAPVVDSDEAKETLEDADVGDEGVEGFEGWSEALGEAGVAEVGGESR